MIDANTASPVADAVVALLDASGRSRSVTTDVQGRFAFLDLREGTFSIVVTKPGWIDGAYGRRRPNGAPQLIGIAAGRRVDDVTVPLWRFGTISGTVFGASGLPLPGIEVDALRRTATAGRWRFVRAGSAQTDNLGVYRLSSLVPGEYIVVAPPGQAAPGGTSFLAKTAAMLLKAGEEHVASRLELKVAPSMSVTGRTMGTAGFITNVMPSLEVADDDDTFPKFFPGSRTLLSDGTFGFFGIPPGRYVIRASHSAQPTGPLVLPPTLDQLPNKLAVSRSLWASQPVDVRDRNISGVTLVLREAAFVSGRVIFDGPVPPAPERIRQIVILLENEASPVAGWSESASSRLTVAGDFATLPVPPGKYFIRANGLPAGWIIKSAMVDGRDAADLPLTLGTRNVTGAVVTFTSRLTELEGHAFGPAGADSTVSVFPADNSMWADFGFRPRRVNAARVDTEGHYRFVGLPPGDYLVAAIPDELAADWAEVEFLGQLSKTATRVHLGDGEKKTVDIRTAQVFR